MAKSNFCVYGDRVLIIPDSIESVSKGGIIIPSSAQSKNYWGVVVDVGAKVDNGIKKGDRVYYEKYSESPVKVGDTEYVIVKQENILGNLKSE